MFRTYEVDVSGAVRPGANTVEISIDSAVLRAAALAVGCSPGEQGQCPSTPCPNYLDGFCFPEYVRKEPCSFGWDWGPAFAPSGIWRPLRLIAPGGTPRVMGIVVSPQTPTDGPLLDAARANRHLGAQRYGERVLRSGGAAGTWRVLAEVSVAADSAAAAGPVAVAVEVVDAAGTVYGRGQTNVSVAVGESVVEVWVVAEGVRPWWPAGYGGRMVYRARATVVLATSDGAVGGGDSGDGPMGTGSAASVALGFRWVELVQAALPGGRSFYFRVNGVPVFVKGANWIPQDVLETRVSVGTLRWMMESFAAAGFNAVRNWGGGVWQQDAFYDLADELGLLVWNEAIFACNDYEAGDAFLRSVAAEVRDNVRRISPHPSVFLWSGNNENEGRYRPGTSAADLYARLTFDTVLANASALDASRPLIGSSPSCGNETTQFPVCENTQTEWAGDVHYYAYDKDGWRADSFPRPRFASEFGYQSWPARETMEVFLNASDRVYNGSLMRGRNRHPGGVEQILQEMGTHLSVPDPNSAAAYTQTLGLTQLNQAVSIQTEVEHYRRIRNECNATVSGCTMGSLYWQANDVWPGASWSSIDWTGRWKALHYAMATAYAPTLVSPFVLNGTLTIYAVSDATDLLCKACALEVRVVNVQDGSVHHAQTAAFSVGPAAAEPVFSASVASLLAAAGCGDGALCVAEATLLLDSGAEAARNWLLLGSPKDASLPDPRCEVTQTAAVPGASLQYDVSWACRGPAPFLHLEPAAGLAGRFSDNWFFAAGPSAESPGSNGTVRLFLRDPANAVGPLWTAAAKTAHASLPLRPDHIRVGSLYSLQAAA